LEHPIFFTPLEEFAKENIRYLQNRTRKRQFFNKSLPRCEPSLAHRFTLFDCSFGKPTSRSKNTRWVREI